MTTTSMNALLLNVIDLRLFLHRFWVANSDWLCVLISNKDEMNFFHKTLFTNE